MRGSAHSATGTEFIREHEGEAKEGGPALWGSVKGGESCLAGGNVSLLSRQQDYLEGNRRVIGMQGRLVTAEGWKKGKEESCNHQIEPR